MEKVIVTCDSGIDPLNMDNMIPATIIENKDKTYRDVIDIDSKSILEKTKNGSVFTTASPILSDFIDKFESILKDKEDVVHLSMSSGISEGSFNSASLAANELNDEYENKRYVVDTFTGATGGMWPASSVRGSSRSFCMMEAIFSMPVRPGNSKLSTLFR